MRFNRTTALVMAGTMSLGLLAACSSNKDDAASPSGTTTPGGDTSSAPSNEPVTITVAGLLPGAEKAAVDALNDRITQFQEKYPNITVKSKEYQWLPTTFAADLAGGTLPTVFEVPATDTKTLIANKQLADMDAQLKQEPYANDFNEQVIAGGKGEDGHVYAVPAKSFYSVALHYNRELFTKAGLDPDKPPTTWQEVRDDAKVIKEKTGKAGYGMMAKDNAGGWQLVAAAYSRGGRVQTEANGTYTATLTDPAVKASLQFLSDLKKDGSLYPDSGLGWAEINAAFAAGKFAMYTSGSDIYTALVQNQGVTKDNLDYGLTAIPTENGGGALTGGTYAGVRPDASDAEKDAAMKWIDFWYLAKLSDQDQAVADAKILADQKPPQAVGTPVLPIFSKEKYQESLTWIKDYINVPLDHMTGYTDVMFTQPLIPEAARATQDTYGLLFPIVQSAITKDNPDFDSLLAKANTASQKLIEKSK
ncbi:ABC transporter substrate-binding protein [Cellulomonas sp. HZM]|uniref:ABC transporter substrate-binding protein n=1 Tax=Cellulomonas sp. HZM TaxID=1454010 RepID=UPI00049373AB|nr:extracellular solute-binding protein [Cellulomonas sp. HZM]